MLTLTDALTDGDLLVLTLPLTDILADADLLEEGDRGVSWVDVESGL